MAANNKFATILHKKSHRITLILIYTLLEWILIALLLLNGFFSYLIAKFATFFGLKPPCILCSRVDHLFEPESESKRSYRNLLCDSHKIEVSQLGFCSSHKRLAETGDMCEDCAATRPAPGGGGAVLSWMRRSEMGERDLRCSCCGIALESGFYSPYFILKPSWGGLLDRDAIFEVEDGKVVGFDVLDGANDKVKEDSGAEGLETSNKDTIFELEEVRNMVPVEFGNDESTVEERIERTNKDSAFEVQEGKDLSLDDEKVDNEIIEQEDKPLIDFNDIVTSILDDSIEAMDQRADNIIDSELCDERLVPLELIDSITMTTVCNLNSNRVIGEESHGTTVRDLGPLDIGVVLVEEKKMVMVSGEVFEEDNKIDDGDANCEISIGSEIPEEEHVEQARVHEPNSLALNLQEQIIESFNQTSDTDREIETVVSERMENNTSLSLDQLSPLHNESGHEIQSIELEASEPPTLPRLNHGLIEQNEVEGERSPKTPVHTNESSQAFQIQAALLFERTESLDGSAASEADSGEPLTVDRLKSALQSERSALRALYLELEEERSASAIAANQTMAMITRLQEEKAAMQMEALQYQRMMEEQSEYDQEALHLLNELVVKREREKQELEREMEGYRQKLRAYERRFERKREHGSLSSSLGSLSAEEESDDLSNNGGNDETAPVHLVSLEASLDEFEQERVSILEQLKGLEERLFALEEEEEEGEEVEEEGLNGNSIEKTDLNENDHNELNEDYESLADVLHVPSNGSVKLGYGGKNYKGKRLLPLFDAVSLEENGENCENGDESLNNDKQRERIAIEEEVGEVYERLQALEADREFLKHCIKSLKKGDEGLDLLQEILQHLRDLRRVELRARNGGDGLAPFTV